MGSRRIRGRSSRRSTTPASGESPSDGPHRAVLLVGSADLRARLLPLLVGPVAQRREAPAASKIGAAVDRDGLAVDVIGPRTHEQGGEIAQLGHPADPTHRVGGTGFATAAARVKARPGALG